MRRALAMTLGAVMAVGSAAPAAAASHIDFSGYYRVMYMSETNTGYGRESRSFTDSYFQDRLNLDVTFNPTDEISVYWRMRGPGSYERWGRTNGRKNANSLYTQFIYGEIKQDWGTILVGRIDDDLDCYGLCAFGYLPETIPIFTTTGVFDRGDILDSIRYTYDWENGFSILAQYGKLDNNDQSSGRIVRNPLTGAYEDGRNGASDQDWDRFQLQAAYAWDGGGVALHAFYDRNATGNGVNWRDYSRPAGTYRAWTEYGATNKIESWGLNPAFMHSWGDFSIHFEGMAQWGKAYYNYNRMDANNNFLDRRGEYSRKANGYGAYLDFDYNYGPGNVTLAGWWVSGSDMNDSKNKSLADLVGGNFYPLLVAYNGINSNPGENRYYGDAGAHVSAIGFANNAYANYVFDGHIGAMLPTGAATIGYASLNGIDLNLNSNVVDWTDLNNPANYLGDFYAQVLQPGGNINRTRTVSFNNGTDANHWAAAITGNHAFTDDISMHYGLAYLGLNKPNYRVAKAANFDSTRGAGQEWNVTGYSTQDKDLGFEVDLGFTVKLLDNLSFTTAFGYMFNGDAYKSLRGYRVNNPDAGGTLVDGNSISAVWQDADDSYVWFNSLTFAF